MSIINDALKKTQLNLKSPKIFKKKKDEQPSYSGEDITNVYNKLYKSREDQHTSANPQKGDGKKSTANDSIKLRGAKKWLKTCVAFAFLIASVSFSYYFLKDYKPLQDYIHSITNNRRSLASHTLPAPAKKRTYKPGELVLNGTSLIDGRQVALINDEIYEVGEMIDGKKIISIGMTKVELRDDTKIFTIKVR